MSTTLEMPTASSPANGRGGDAAPNTIELSQSTIAALMLAMRLYDRLVAQCNAYEPLRPAAMTLARQQAEHAAAKLIELAEAFRTETAGLDTMLHEYSAQFLLATTAGVA